VSLECTRALVQTHSRNAHAFLLGIFWCQEHPTSSISWMKKFATTLEKKQPAETTFTYFSVLVRFIETFVLLRDHCRKIWKTTLSSEIGIVVCIYLCFLGIGRQVCRSKIGIIVCIFFHILGIGRQICPSATGIIVCIFLCLLGIGRQLCPSAIGIIVCIFLCLPEIGRQMYPSAIGIVVCIFLCLLGIRRQFVQVQS
jgi:hypothetical protein